MRQSTLFAPMLHTIASEYRDSAHGLLLRGGYIRESTAGRFYLLPLGIRVQDRICRVINQELEKLAAQQILTPVLHPVELWQETARDTCFSFELMRVTDRTEREFILGGTAEEMVTALVRQHQISERQLPLCLYQFSQKFRDELRVRGGLLRAKEFLMKDAYSFHATQECAFTFYEQMCHAYETIFARLGLATKRVTASNGEMQGDFSHEFVVESIHGESTFLEAVDGSLCVHVEATTLTEQAHSPTTGAPILRKKGIEVGNTFYLGQYYSTKMKDVFFTGSDGKQHPYYMGCYGIGIGRTMATVAQQYLLSTPQGMRVTWPADCAPFQVHLIQLGDRVSSVAQELYARLRQANVDLLYDDRATSTGVKFAEADLIGAPVRLVISDKSVTAGGVEYQKIGDEAERRVVSFDELLALVS